jgi:Cd2+/Zn2+-exporting ATPase
MAEAMLPGTGMHRGDYEDEPLRPVEAEPEMELDFSVMVGISMLCATFLAFGQAAEWRAASPALATTCFVLAVIAGGAVPLLEALPNAARLQFEIDGLMVLAALCAVFLGRPREGAILMLLFSLSHGLEAYAIGRTRKSLDDLKEHWNESAVRLRDGQEEVVPIRDLAVGDHVIVRPGERIALDAVVLRGNSAVHEAAITGEPLPVDKGPGDSVFGGTVNDYGSMLLEITNTAGESTLAKLIRLVESAQEQEALTQRVVKWTTDRYSTLVLAGSFLVLIIPYIYLRVPFGDALYRAMTLLVVASPCAVIVATPSALFSAITAAAHRGILLKGGVHIEAAAAVRVVALDKTGTLTRGKPEVTAIRAVAGLTENELLAWAAAAEQLSEHPLAKPIVVLAQSRKLTLAAATDFRAVVGRGVSAQAAGRQVRVGSRRWLASEGLSVPDALTVQEDPLAHRGERALFVALDDAVVGFIALADTLRPEAADLVRDLKSTGIRRVVMLTGDTAAAAEAIASAVGLDEYRAELLPGDKLAAIDDLRKTYGRVIMVGDGVNDAPALARADVGVAMGGIGSDLALESADVILVKDDLWRLPAFIDLAKVATRTVLLNLLFALSVIVIMVIIVFASGTGAGRLTLPKAVGFHEGSTLLVVFNGLRLLRWRSRYDAKMSSPDIETRDVVAKLAAEPDVAL